MHDSMPDAFHGSKDAMINDIEQMSMMIGRLLNCAPGIKTPGT